MIAVLAFLMGGWWMDTPVRLIQTNLREKDTALDVRRLVDQLSGFRANAVLFGMGGIVAHYPTRVPLHPRSAYLPKDRDPFGELVAEAHRRGIRVIGRFDFSKAHKPAFDAHPEWFIRRASGGPVIYNGLYSACINGGYYREFALQVLAEALERYPVDALFFNMFGNQLSDYSGNWVGPCHCNACESRFRARHNRAIPEKPDAAYRQFLTDSAHEVAALFADFIHKKRPGTGFFTYVQAHTDSIMSESNTAVNRPLPLWPYSASDNVNRGRNSEPGKMAINLCMSFIDYPWRFATVPPAEIALRLYQSLAHGGVAALNMHGTMDQEDASALAAAKPVFHWAAEREDLYVGQESAARVLLLSGGGSSYRGLFRILTENHIPFAVSANARRLAEFDLVVAAETPPELDRYLKNGGRAIVAAPRAPGLDLPRPVREWQDVKGYFRIHDRELFPNLSGVNLTMLDGAYTEYPPAGKPLLTLIPPSMFGPPERVHMDAIETDKPGLLLTPYGKGRLAYLPWDLGGLYYRLSSPPHAAILTALIDHLLPEGRQIKTNAHPLVEMSLMRQTARNRTLLHLINLTGHSQTGYFPPVPMRGIEIQVRGQFETVEAARLGVRLAASQESGYTRFILPELSAYEAVILR